MAAGSLSNSLVDSFERRFSYLRLSVTDACNFRCQYCLPDGYRKSTSCETEDFLTLDEIRRLVVGFAAMGLFKVRLTGGEPTLRKDLLEIAETVSGIAGVQSVALSTNGYRLRQLARPLLDRGVRSVNVSVDSLDRYSFEKITGQDRLQDVLAGIDEALSVGFTSVKINAVLLKGLNDTEVPAFLDYVRDRPVTVRFIELMPTGVTRDFFARHHVRGDVIQHQLSESGWRSIPRGLANGPASEFAHPDFLGGFGMIAPYAKDFCDQCNRLRVSALGAIRLCLFGDGQFSLRRYLQKDSDMELLQHAVRSLLTEKKMKSHGLHEGNYGINQTFSAIGG